MDVLLVLLIPGATDLAAGNYIRAIGIALGVVLTYLLFLPLGIFWHLLAIGRAFNVLRTFLPP